MVRHFHYHAMDSRRVLDLRGGGGIQDRKRLMRIPVFYQKKLRTQLRFDRKAVIASSISSFSLPEYRGEK